MEDLMSKKEHYEDVKKYICISLKKKKIKIIRSLQKAIIAVREVSVGGFF